MPDFSPLYPNQQLQSVSLCTYFAGRISAQTRFADVQREFDKRLPRLYVPHAIHGQAPSLQPYQLRSDDSSSRKESLAVAVNQATYISFNYPGYATFVDAAREVLSRTYELLEIDELLRVEYRYENLIAVERVDGILCLDKVITRLVPDGCGSEMGLTSLKTEWRARWPRGTQGISAAVEEADGVDVLRLVISATCEQAGPSSRLGPLAEAAHEQARSCFESIITDEFREILKGGNEEAVQ